MNGTKTTPMLSGRRSPLIIEPSTAAQSLPDVVGPDRAKVDALLLEHGALLFRGFAVRTLADFDGFVGAITDHRLDYIYRSTPRTALGNRIFTATEYPPAEEIPLHNECSYQREWPLKIALCCLVPAAAGGETPIADMRRVTAAVGEPLVEKFGRLGVRYVRHYRPHFDVPWQRVFQTEDKDEVGRYCTVNGIAHEWLDQETLRTVQVCQGTARHPQSGELVMFNQAHLFHVSSVGLENAKTMIDFFGADRLPRQTYFGDGQEISSQELEAVHAAFRSQAITFPWRAGDIALLDNMQFAHGRRPFKGERKVVVALMEQLAAAV
jgi:alpha-ketoglutarate-dependent taurine dioxygenase